MKPAVTLEKLFEVLHFHPNDFRFDLPDVIGNYNPDWAVIRRNSNGDVKPYLVRETKGTTNLKELQHAQEKFKIYAAQRCFDKLGIDYRVVDATTPNWWQPMHITIDQISPSNAD
jgi:type III restriction enzyme